jgi:hypothetical protein
MKATLQSTSDGLRQLEKEKVELAARFAALEVLREIVRQKQATQQARVAQLKSRTLQVDF